MSGRFPEPTYRLSELTAELRGLVKQAFSSVWVTGEIQRLKTSYSGHVYFELIEKDDRDGIVAKMDAVIWRTNHARIRRHLAATSQELSESLEIRCRCRMDFWAPGGRLQLVVEEVDPAFTLGLLEQRRRQTLEALGKSGLLDKNRSLELPVLPLRIGLVTSAESAAYHDFLSSLEESGYGFEVCLVHAAVQGRGAEEQISSALGLLASRASSLDCVALVRGGGSRSDLAVFDSRPVAEAVARFPLPVLTGLGHEIDESICDRVAHTPLKTPTKAAELLIERVAGVEAEVEELRRRLLREAGEPLARARRRLDLARRGLRSGAGRLHAYSVRLEEMGRLLGRMATRQLRAGSERCAGLEQRLGSAAPRFLEHHRRRPRELQQRILANARGRLAAARAQIEGLSRLCVGLSPARTLERGFSLTRDSEGRILRDSQGLSPGDLLTTELVRGTLKSRVEE